MNKNTMVNMFDEPIDVDFFDDVITRFPNDILTFADWLIEESKPNHELVPSNYWEKLRVRYEVFSRLLCASLDARLVKFVNEPVRIVFAITPDIAESVTSAIKERAFTALQQESAPMVRLNEMFFAPQGEEDFSFWIEESRLRQCWGKRSRVVVPNEIKKLGLGCFWDCDWLEEIIVPDHISHIGSKAFCSCENLKKIQLPRELLLISEEMFRECKRLQSISMSDHVQIICSRAFWDCTALREIKFSENLKFICSIAFLDCISLSEVHFPESLLAIYENAFEGCTNLKKAYIPKNTVVAKNAFPTTTEIIRY